eukprot:Nk52_evm5s365 gene=Nk52_evmTU5s365
MEGRRRSERDNCVLKVVVTVALVLLGTCLVVERAEGGKIVIQGISVLPLNYPISSASSFNSIAQASDDLYRSTVSGGVDQGSAAARIRAQQAQQERELAGGEDTDAQLGVVGDLEQSFLLKEAKQFSGDRMRDKIISTTPNSWLLYGLLHSAQLREDRARKERFLPIQYLDQYSQVLFKSGGPLWSPEDELPTPEPGTEDSNLSGKRLEDYEKRQEIEKDNLLQGIVEATGAKAFIPGAGLGNAVQAAASLNKRRQDQLYEKYYLQYAVLSESAAETLQRYPHAAMLLCRHIANPEGIPLFPAQSRYLTLKSVSVHRDVLKPNPLPGAPSDGQQRNDRRKKVLDMVRSQSRPMAEGKQSPLRFKKHNPASFDPRVYWAIQVEDPEQSVFSLGMTFGTNLKTHIVRPHASNVLFPSQKRRLDSAMRDWELDGEAAFSRYPDIDIRQDYVAVPYGRGPCQLSAFHPVHPSSARVLVDHPPPSVNDIPRIFILHHIRPFLPAIPSGVSSSDATTYASSPKLKTGMLGGDQSMWWSRGGVQVTGEMLESELVEAVGRFQKKQRYTGDVLEDIMPDEKEDKTDEGDIEGDEGSDSSAGSSSSKSSKPWTSTSLGDVLSSVFTRVFKNVGDKFPNPKKEIRVLADKNTWK